ncbi:MAG: hypothetical protein IKC39_04450 [Clostridia bacterium]|nr:hypothetical protein [Clostridia bacterium]
MENKEIKKPKKEGRRVRSLDPMHYVGNFFMKTRNDATNFFSESIDIRTAEEYIRQKREQGLKDFSMMHVFLASFVRLYSQHPEMNRFIRGQRIYARNDIEIVMTIKKEMKLNGDDTVIKLNYEPDATAEEIYHITNKIIEEARNESGDFDDSMKLFNYIPRFIMRFAASVLNVMDYYGLIPKSLTKISPFHGSLVITSLGSLGIPPVYHHLYNFGNIPIFFAFGKRYNKYEITKDGTPEKVTYMDYRISCDERIADGHAYSVALRYINSLLRNPSQLDERPEKIVEDIP